MRAGQASLCASLWTSWPLGKHVAHHASYCWRGSWRPTQGKMYRNRLGFPSDCVSGQLVLTHNLSVPQLAMTPLDPGRRARLSWCCWEMQWHCAPATSLFRRTRPVHPLSVVQAGQRRLPGFAVLCATNIFGPNPGCQGNWTSTVAYGRPASRDAFPPSPI